MRQSARVLICPRTKATEEHVDACSDLAFLRWRGVDFREKFEQRLLQAGDLDMFVIVSEVSTF